MAMCFVMLNHLLQDCQFDVCVYMYVCVCVCMCYVHKVMSLV